MLKNGTNEKRRYEKMKKEELGKLLQEVAECLVNDEGEELKKLQKENSFLKSIIRVILFPDIDNRFKTTLESPGENSAERIINALKPYANNPVKWQEPFFTAKQYDEFIDKFFELAKENFEFYKHFK